MSRPLYDMKTGVEGVRLATPDDEGEIFALLSVLHAENGLFTMDNQKVIDGIRYATKRQGGMIWVIEEDHHIVASLGMLITCEWYSKDDYLLERWNFVHPDYRRSEYGRMLLDQAKWCSDWWLKETGRRMPLMVGVQSHARTAAKVRLYARSMACIGAYFIYGRTPRQDDKLQEELRQVQEMNRKSRRDGTKDVRPVAETIIHVSQREASHGR